MGRMDFTRNLMDIPTVAVPFEVDVVVAGQEVIITAAAGATVVAVAEHSSQDFPNPIGSLRNSGRRLALHSRD
jgi:hypothetical protein